MDIDQVERRNAIEALKIDPDGAQIEKLKDKLHRIQCALGGAHPIDDIIEILHEGESGERVESPRLMKRIADVGSAMRASSNSVDESKTTIEQLKAEINELKHSRLQMNEIINEITKRLRGGESDEN